MAKDPSPLLGYNNNIRHKNRVFHIQTEDSGVRHPHIITHLFMDGGRILKSVKTSYAEHLGVEKMADMVRKMMKDQHKGMLIALRDGQFDVIIDGGDAPKPVPVPIPAPSPSAATLEPPVAASSAPAVAPVASPVSPPRASSPDLPPDVSSVPDLDIPRRPPSPSQPELPPLPASSPQLGSSHSVPFEASPSDLQPPPANMFRPRTGGNYSTVVTPPVPEPKPAPARPPTVRPPSPRAPARPASVPPGATVSRSTIGKPSTTAPASSRPANLSPGAPPRPPPIRRGSSPPAPPVAPDPTTRIARRPGVPAVVTQKAPESRYASARPAAIFGQAKPRGGSSIFGEDIISDKSLDEVIMSYLAEDAKDGSSDPKRRK